MRGKTSRMARREALAGYLCVSPWIIGFLAFSAIPIALSIGLAFTEYKIIAPPQWVGLANFRQMFTGDPLILHALKVTAIYTLASVPLRVIASLALAMLLNQAVKGLSFFRAAMYVAAVVPGVATAWLFRWLFNPTIGVVNVLLGYVGIQGPKWFLSADWALPTLILMGLWGIGGGMVLYLAALQGVPTDLYDAADVDGTRLWTRFRHVTIPLISPVIFFNLVKDSYICLKIGVI